MAIKTASELIARIDQAVEARIKQAHDSNTPKDPNAKEVKKEDPNAVKPEGGNNDTPCDATIPAPTPANGNELEKSVDKVASQGEEIVNKLVGNPFASANIASDIALTSDLLAKIATADPQLFKQAHDAQSTINNNFSDMVNMQKLASSAKSILDRLPKAQRDECLKQASVHRQVLSGMNQEQAQAYIMGVKYAEAMNAASQAPAEGGEQPAPQAPSAPQGGVEDPISALVSQMVAEKVINEQTAQQLLQASQQGPEAFIQAVQAAASNGALDPNIAQQITSAVQQGMSAEGGEQPAPQAPAEGGEQPAPQAPQGGEQAPAVSEKTAAVLDMLNRAKYASVAEGVVSPEDADLNADELIPSLTIAVANGVLDQDTAGEVVEEVLNSPEVSDEEKQIIAAQADELINAAAEGSEDVSADSDEIVEFIPALVTAVDEGHVAPEVAAQAIGEVLSSPEIPDEQKAIVLQQVSELEGELEG